MCSLVRLPVRPARFWQLVPLGLVLGSACLLGACAGRGQTAATPVQTLARYRDALERDDPKAAYALLTKTAQQSLPYEQFAQQWQDTKVERSAQAAQLQKLQAGGFSGGFSRGGARLPDQKLSARACWSRRQRQRRRQQHRTGPRGGHPTAGLRS